MNGLQKQCNHTRVVPAHWGPSYKSWDCNDYPYDGRELTKQDWVYETTEGTYRDTGLHTYQCTQCGLVKYYSEAARAWFEDGIPSDILGLGGSR